MKAQVSVEFIIILIILLSAISIISVVSIIKTGEIEIFNLQRETERILEEMSATINTVYLEGDGFITNVTLPQRIRGFNYTVLLSSQFLIITVQNTSFSTHLFTNVSGEFVKGSNTIKNENGEVKII